MFYRVVIAVLLGVLLLSTAQAADFVVVVHPDNPISQLTRDEVSDLFLVKANRWPSGGDAEPVDLVTASPVREAFSLAVHKRSTSAVQNYWQRRIFSGRAVPPPTRPTDTDVIAYVRQRPGAIGYVAASSVTDDVKVVAIEFR